MTAKVLMLDTWPPAPERDAASLQIVRLISLLEDLGMEITFGSPGRRAFQADYRPGLPAHIDEIVGHDEIDRHLRDHGDEYDVVWLVRAEVPLVHLDAITQFAPQARTVFDTLDLPYVRGLRGAKVTGNAQLLREAVLAKQATRQIVEQCDVTTVVSESERAQLQAEHPEADVAVVPLIFEPTPTDREHDERDGIVFIGNFLHHPNGDALRYAYDEIVPLLRARLPDLPITIVGSHIPEGVVDADPHTTVAGYVDDLRDVLDRTLATFAPLRFGAGVNGKVLISLASGVPAVVSELAAEGIASDGDGLLVARTPEEYVDAIASLRTDPQCWRKVRARGLDTIASRQSAATVAPIVADLLSRLGVMVNATTRSDPRGTR